jgi:hypothetical protein
VFLLHEVHFVSNFITLVNEHPDNSLQVLQDPRTHSPSSDIRHLLISDEAQFELFGCVNRQKLAVLE